MHKKLLFTGLLLAGLILPSPTLAEMGPAATVEGFYQWYVSNQDRLRQKLSQQKDLFEPVLYQQLIQAFQKQPQDGQRWLDFDPFSDTQVRTYSSKVRSVKLKEDKAIIDIDVYAGLRQPGSPVPIQVLLQRQNDKWQITNFVYRQNSNSLLQILQDINQPSP
uniref:DUF3828 domain-containing protein n=1 Tax=Cyanothece sp. (strain PCC 7425 / ATCC 29141) TaxID=395961 RepID=B8HJZ2_CYAP4